MVARIVGRVALWLGIIAALAMPLAPFVYRWLYPPRTPAVPANSLWDFIGALPGGLASIGDGIAIMVWTLGLAAATLVASLVALIMAWCARESRVQKLLCGLPVLLTVVVWGVMILVK